jgi:hypothetical protein
VEHEEVAERYSKGNFLNVIKGEVLCPIFECEEQRKRVLDKRIWIYLEVYKKARFSNRENWHGTGIYITKYKRNCKRALKGVGLKV